MSSITQVETSDGYVRVRLGVLDHETLITVEARRSLEHFPDFVPEQVSVTWGGTGDRELEWAEAFENSLHEAVRVAKQMNGLLAHPDSMRGDSMDMPEIDMQQMPDYLLALYLLLHGRPVYYRRTHVLTGEESERVVDRDGMVRTAIAVAKEAERA